MTSLQSKSRNVIRITRLVYSQKELEEIKRNAAYSGAKIISTTPIYDGEMISVILDLDKNKRQF
ncbi:hypothetical protein H8S33_14575 [Ornithinibacillus sp. BX22]|uniref:Uncharacterized protein n=2 Tax=Ornithinibacillus TaxID=484508 RepID=A0A923L7V9_9BACI|nr:MULTISPECIES: hypothetical protein [Ornithinibacillus]MBC5638019.1 hypothetical protein [Ornithinibacillus hominis]MBS3681907.1 hypothetical protein [Ornithinibacillus massiliensis]